MLKFLRPLWYAGRLLTRLPFPDPQALTPHEIGRGIPWYPIIGLILGILLGVCAWTLKTQDPNVTAAILLIIWVWGSGALHLDGLADSADAWVGGIGSKEQTLRILKDPACGPSGVTAISLILSIKWATLHALIIQNKLWLLPWLPMLGRAQLLLLFLSTPVARMQGMAAQQVKELPRSTSWSVLVITGIVFTSLAEKQGLILLGAALIIFVWLRHAMLVRLAGFTGDTAGALVELTEASLLIISVIN